MYNNHETDVTRAAQKNAERIAKRMGPGLRLSTVLKVAGALLAAATAYNVFF